jgi:hypothetical protein
MKSDEIINIILALRLSTRLGQMSHWDPSMERT